MPGETVIGTCGEAAEEFNKGTSSSSGEHSSGVDEVAQAEQARSVKRTPCPGSISSAMHVSVNKCADTDFLRGKLHLKRDAILASVAKRPDENPGTCKVSRIAATSDWASSVVASAMQGLGVDPRHPPSDADPRSPLPLSGLVPHAPTAVPPHDSHSEASSAKDARACAESLAKDLLARQAYDSASCVSLFDLMDIRMQIFVDLRRALPAELRFLC